MLLLTKPLLLQPFSLLTSHFQTLLSSEFCKTLLDLDFRHERVKEAMFIRKSPPPSSSPSETLEKVFLLFDENEDGLVSKEEMYHALQKLGLQISDEQLDSLMRSASENRDGSLKYEEFKSLYKSLSLDDEEEEEDAGPATCKKERELWEAFCVFDKNGDGVISVVELQSVLCSLGFSEGGDVRECEEMIRRVDSKRDGGIDFGEFKQMMMASEY